MYAITGSGEAYLGAWAKSLERYQHSMDDFFELYGSKPPPTCARQSRGLAGDPVGVQRISELVL